MSNVKVFILGLLLVPSVAFSDNAQLSFNAPTRVVTYVDAGPYDNPAGYYIYQRVGVINDPTITEFTILNLPAGDYTYIATAFSSAGVESMVSNAGTKTSTGLRVIDDRAYVVTQSRLGFVLSVYGTVPLMTQCDEENSVTGFGTGELYHRVPIELVVPTGTVDPQVAVAKCG